MKTWFRLLFFAVTLAVHGMDTHAAGGEALAQPPGNAANRLARLSLPDETGHVRRLADWQGQIWVLNFWATWCPPCLKELPSLARLSRRFARNGVQFVGIGIDEADKVREFHRTADIPFPLLIGDMDVLSLTAPLGNGTLGLPFTLVFDREGKIVLQKAGIVNEAQLSELLSRLTRAR